MDYQRIYTSLVLSAKGRLKHSCDGLEKHRIIPGHQGGTYASGNVALLTLKEHRVAHKLLYKIHRKIGDLCAANLMSSDVTSPRLARARASHMHQKHRKEGFWSSEKQREKTLKSIAKQRKTGFAFHRPEVQKRNAAKANRRVLSVEDGKITSWAKRLLHEKKTGYAHVWIDF